ncbi:hypothetical protein LPUS_01066 [Lasallia pustulata]|uniref:Uncharacterized protein n=1 Tax=Lasallia pustulata TaxID=136370 RepID=A0A1W5D719_9LECA|nr:hypothetical protein LPUS_01066 [Lasallia pustulata]
MFKFVVGAVGGEIPKVEDMDDVHVILVPGIEYDSEGDEGWILMLVNLIQGERLVTFTDSFLSQLHFKRRVPR